MGAAVELHDHLLPLDSELGIELIENLARYAEGLLDEAAVKKIYRFSDEDWDRLGGNDDLVEKIEAAKRRKSVMAAARGSEHNNFSPKRPPFSAPSCMATAFHPATRSKARASFARSRLTGRKPLHRQRTGS